MAWPRARGRAPATCKVYFESIWSLEAAHRPLRFAEKDAKDSLLDFGTRMLALRPVRARHRGGRVEEPFAVPLIYQDTGEVLDRDLVGTLNLVERPPR